MEGVAGDNFVSTTIPVPLNEDDHPAVAAAVAVDPSAPLFRHTFHAVYRAGVVGECEAAPHGEKSAVLRREGLYQCQVRRWASARDAPKRGTAAARRPHRATTPGAKDDLGRLRTGNEVLVGELAKSQAVV